MKNPPSPNLGTSDHFNGKNYHNPGFEYRKNSSKAVLKWWVTRRSKSWPKKAPGKKDMPPKMVEGSSLRVSFIGHSTVLIQAHGINILTDPVWGNRASPLRFYGPHRVTPPGIDFEKLPPIHAVLLSHNHYDHMDTRTLKRLWKKHHPRIIAPLGNGRYLRAINRKIRVEEYDWAETASLNPQISVTLEPAFHWSSRTPFDKNLALWSAFVIQTPSGCIYFAGDTAFNEGIHFQQAGKKYGEFRFALIPIGAYEPRELMRDNHMNPEEAVRAAILLNAKKSMGIHLQTFKGLTDEAFDDPIIDLKHALQKHRQPQESFITLKSGEYHVIE